MPPSERKLQDMGLTATEKVTNDESLFYSDWDRKLILHEAIKASTNLTSLRGLSFGQLKKVQLLTQPHAT